jgi:hypothetical protein
MIRALPACLLLLVAAPALPACQMMPERQPARLVTADAETLEALREALAAAVGQANAELGAGDLAEAVTIAVLPPPLHPLETHSLAMPVLFDLMIEDGRCLAVRQETGEAVELPGVRCVPQGG